MTARQNRPSKVVFLKSKMVVSFSGGRTSAYMARQLQSHFAKKYEMVFVFANTGQECEETLVFADRCDREWQLDLVWIEAAVHPDARRSSTCKVVTFKTAARSGEPFEAVIQKYGIPNRCYLHCTRELKLNPIRSYVESIGWDDYVTAVGIRMDEPQRIKPDAWKLGIVYPLASPSTLFAASEFGDLVATKPQINDWWEYQPFTLQLAEHEGNCKTCFKKSTAKLVRIAQDHPERYEFFDRMEKEYGLNGNNIDGTPRTFFREHMTAQSILALSRLVMPPRSPLSDDDADGGCTESCDAFGDGAS